MKKLSWVLGLVVLLSGCGDSSEQKLLGRWTEPVPGMADKIQGIDLMADGLAKSINMATLMYESWQKDGDKLILKGRSIGNRQTFLFTDEMTIVKLTDETLVLKSGDVEITYTREK